MYLSRIIVLLFLMFGILASGQKKYEREYRIKKSQFPESALAYIEINLLKDVRRLRFYKETDGDRTSYAAKFKKDCLKYGTVFDEEGLLKDIEIVIKPIDIPDDVYDKITFYLDSNFSKHRVLKIHQQYPVGEENTEKTIKIAFQNLMMPYIKYEFVVKGKKENGFEQYELLFNPEGQFEMMRKALPANYDHVLY